MSYDTIRLEIADGVARLTLNRPDKLNSFTIQMHGELRQALKQVRQDESVRCLLLSGAGRAFSAGQDLGETGPGERPLDLAQTLDHHYNPLVRSLRDLPFPVVAAVNGVAAGAGANIALACDLVLAGRSARFIQAFSKIGLVPDSGGTWLLPRLVGLQRAMGLCLLGEPLEAEQALAWGLIWKVVDDDALADEASALAARLAALPTVALGLTKRALHDSATHNLDHQLNMERDLQKIAARSEDHAEGVAAFKEKRQPDFKGR
ncbi:2-(1,2-epoxy-1,2-dihydrophenyl)acetyl-CoA isomerase PaaG [Roseospirillum parvum]|uniref:2-(1,2-epoxy-1,2-dihydrophenyl)acetyl-CoA isomerase n=1 Tax=Roseospirillum parvum TaxID=83401 RepID=A0A1G8E8D1_9PROT|nr:2-(1,2-epoxy-1,2-dihydrophenyl)acetyl-CoA isomerase PaaG [Roseospirillum parvum]SDH66137.1 2-(1,2-epoxy-1,2-dihydrophenyl)acetyl-CoA isomerase [Roseospirillum parvum]